VATTSVTSEGGSAAFRRAVFSQAENLEAAAALARRALAEADLTSLRSGVLIFTGMGASWHALAPAVQALRRAGRRAFAVSPPDLARAPATELADAFVVVSQSGASTETMAMLERVEGSFVVAISATAEGPLTRAADVWLPLGPLPDTPVATLSYTATLQALGFLCDELLGAGRGSKWDAVPELVAATLDVLDGEARAAAGRFQRIHALDAIGGGASVASAAEATLLMREGVRVPATSFETRQYLHGPLEAAGPGLGCLLFGSGRELDLASSLLSYGVPAALVTDRPGAEVPGAEVLTVPSVHELAAPILEILPAQLLAAHLASARGAAIGELRRQQGDTKVA
jgi:glucosamine--fructose-6-phosphate aminotransferase (isomerizing)